MSERKLTYKDYAFVFIQLTLFVAYGLPVRIHSINFPDWPGYAGLVILGLSIFLGLMALAQLNTRLSPFPSPVSNGKLITTGAFKISRHPIYTALIFSGFGYALYKESLFKALIAILLFILFYFKSKFEEKLLLQKFPAYKNYMESTRRFI